MKALIPSPPFLSYEAVLRTAAYDKNEGGVG